MFDINRSIKASGLSKKEVVNLMKEVKKDYPRDPMLYELHMVRALNVCAKPVSRRKVVR